MHTKSLVTAALLVVACALQTGCALYRPAPDKYRSTRPVPTQHDSKPSVTRLLFYSRTLMDASPPDRFELLKRAKDAYARQPNPTTAARLALAYGQPDYTGYAPENGWRYADKALEAGDGYWSPAAAAYLRQFAALCADNDHVRAQLDDTLKQTKTTRQQLARARQSLTRAQQKLHALTRIETQLEP